jgi:hypothetical protein
MGDNCVHTRIERFMTEFGPDLEKACAIDLEQVVETVLGISDNFDVRMRYIIKDRRNDEHLVEGVRILYNPDWQDDEETADGLSELLYPGQGEAHFDEVFIRLCLVHTE